MRVTEPFPCRDLADLNKDGKLTKDGFAVALHLINGKLAGKDVPETLPNSLVPPSHRMKDSAFQAGQFIYPLPLYPYS